ncbi:GumC family protein [Nodosilinea sp. LEGE 07088]|uniref:GumC family protein n=1 Tax=Nodosilinea sp. LEGE 07088 TaxID=2777968 RepID=UPI00187FD6C8|nr:GumC family protein [Nodosilinea sp. LEGE 07088]MBE9137697.1 GumC family protein [Nodosilinea sp. LEGE 07088]
METFQDREQLDISPGSYVRAARNHWLPAALTFFAVLAIATLMSLRLEPTYKASAELLFRISRTPALTGLGEGSEDLDTLVNNQNPLVTETRIISSQPLLEEVIDILSLTNEEGSLLNPNALSQNLTVEVLPGADVVQVSYESRDPEQAAAVVNTVTDVYIQGNFESSLAQATKARELIDQQLPQSEADVQRADEALRRFKEENNVVLLDSQAQSMVALMQDLDQQILTTRAALQEAISRSSQLRSGLSLTPQEAIIVSDLSQATGVQGALLRLQEVQQQLAVDRGFYTDNSPTVENLRNQEDNLSQLLREEVDAIVPSGKTPLSSRHLQVSNQRQTMIASLIDAEIERLSLDQRLAVLSDAREAYNRQADALPFLEQQQEKLASELLVARQGYESLLQKRQDLRIAENQASGSVVVLEPAVVPQNPLSVRRFLVIAMGVLVGALLATTVIFLLELNDSVYARRSSDLSN